MTKYEALKQALESNRKHESHRTLAETRYWCDQYKLLAQQAIEALAQPAQEPVAWMYQCSADNSKVLMSKKQNWADSGGGVWEEKPLYATPPQRPWVGMMRGVRVEGDTVIISVKGGNDAARELCGALVKEIEA